MTGPNITCTGTLATALHSTPFLSDSNRKAFTESAAFKIESLKAKCYYYDNSASRRETKATNVFFFLPPLVSSGESTRPILLLNRMMETAQQCIDSPCLPLQRKIGIRPVKSRGATAINNVLVIDDAGQILAYVGG